MILTTTQDIEGKVIERYIGLVSGVDHYLLGGLFGEGALKSAGGVYSKGAFGNAEKMLEEAAATLGADAVVGIQMSTTIGTGSGGSMYIQLMGTAVKLTDAEDEDELPML